MNKLVWLDEKDIATLEDWEVIQIIESRSKWYGLINGTIYLCLCRRLKDEHR